MDATDFMFSSGQPASSMSYNISPSLTTLPGVTQGAGGFLGSGMSGLDIANGALSGLQTIAGLWNAFQAQKLAKKQFKFNKDFALTNLGNQMQSYNTAIADRARSRGVMEGQSQGQVEGYINANSLSRSTGRSGGAPVSGISAAALSNYGNYVRPDPRG